MEAAELEWIAWTTPITTGLGAAVAASDHHGRAVACRQHILPNTIMNVGHSDREIDVGWLDRHPSTRVRRHLERYELDGRRVYLLNRGSLVNLAGGLGIAAPQLFDPFAAIMLLGLDVILSGQTADLPDGVQRYPRRLEARVAQALATGSG